MDEAEQPRHNWRRDRITRRTSNHTERRQRREILSREPICRVCRKRRAVEVDHKLPVCLGGDDMPENLQPICRPCHLSKTAREANHMRWHVHKIGRRREPQL